MPIPLIIATLVLAAATLVRALASAPEILPPPHRSCERNKTECL
jgi:hypothetical protein